MNGTHMSQRISLEKTNEHFPGHLALAVAAIKPLVPASFNFKVESLQRDVVPRDPIICVMSVEFLAQLDMLLADWSVPVMTTPVSDAPHCSSKATRRGLAFDDLRSPRVRQCRKSI